MERMRVYMGICEFNKRRHFFGIWFDCPTMKRAMNMNENTLYKYRIRRNQRDLCCNIHLCLDSKSLTTTTKK